MAGGTRIPVLLARQGQRIVVRPVGSCTLAIAGSVQDGLKQYRRPETTDLYFDLSRADAIDSTFTGLLLSLVTSKADASVPAIHLLAPSPLVIKALQGMHVLALFDVCSSISDPPAQWQELTGEEPGREQMTDLVIDAHQHLIDADPRNAEAFGRVVDGLRARRRPGPDTTPDE